MRIDGLTGSAFGLPEGSSVRGGSSFADLLRESMASANETQLNAESLLEQAAIDDTLDPNLIADAVTKADLAMRTMIQVRNKLVQAFQELRQLQV